MTNLNPIDQLKIEIKHEPELTDDTITAKEDERNLRYLKSIQAVVCSGTSGEVVLLKLTSGRHVNNELDRRILSYAQEDHCVAFRRRDLIQFAKDILSELEPSTLDQILQSLKRLETKGRGWAG